MRDPSPVSDQTTTESPTSSTPLPDGAEQSVSPTTDMDSAAAATSTGACESTDKPDAVHSDPAPPSTLSTESSAKQNEPNSAEVCFMLMYLKVLHTLYNVADLMKHGRIT